MTDLPAALPRAQGLRGRVGVAVAGHAVASGSNLVMTALAARELSTVEFGVFGVVFALNVVIVGVERSLVGEPALVRDAAAARPVYSSGLALSAVAGTAIAVAGLILGGSTSWALIAFAVVLPGMVVQDVGRHLAFASLRPDRALLLDGTWAALQIAGIAVLLATTDASAATIVLVWGGTAWVAGAVSLVLSHCTVPAPSLRWIRDSWSLSWRYLAGFAASAGVVQITALALGLIVSVAAVGSVRGAQIILGPLIPLYAGVSAVLVPEGARSMSDEARFRAHLIRISLLMAIAGAVLTGVGLLLPDAAGRQLLGDTWAPAQGILLPAGLSSMLNGATAGALIGLRASRAVRTTLAVQLRLVPVQLVVPIVGAVGWQTEGFMWGTAGAAFVAGVLWWREAARPLGSLP